MDLLTLSEHLGTPDYFITFMLNDNWPELQRVFQKGPIEDFNLTHDKSWRNVQMKLWLPSLSQNRVPITNYTVEACVAFNQRLRKIKEILFDKAGGPLGKLGHYWIRREYQKKGSVHAHMVS